jgi:DNA-binding transcriptional LysR family regulator
MLRLSYYTDVIHAALAGHGIALGWNCLVNELLQQERLRRVTDLRMRTSRAAQP